jgi:DNA-binding MarR family transcriptional regulator
LILDDANRFGKYVNMADIKLETQLKDAEAVALVELLFFAYRDFVADPDHILEGLGFGRAHHRVIHFVGRKPGLTVAQLLDILQITKQSLARVLKELIDKNYVFQREGAIDRRQRLVHLTAEGEALRQKLIAPQIARFSQAVAETGVTNYRELLFHLINVENRKAASEWVERIEGVK